MKLFPHNQKAVDAVRKHYSDGNRKAAVVHATGTGKSLVAAEVASVYDKVLVLAPNNFVLDETRKWMPNAEFCTYMSMLYNLQPKTYDLIVLDEFHRAGAPEWSKGVDRLLEANKEANLLGLSATHVRYLDDNRNMADELFDGNIVSYINLKDAIDRGILPNPTYISALYLTSEEVKKMSDKINASNNSIDWKNDKTRHLSGIKDSWDKASGVSGIMRKYFRRDMKRIIVFCSKVCNAEESRFLIGKWLSGAGFNRVMFYHIDYTNERIQEHMAMFQEDDYDGIKVAISVNMLNEGIHVPRVDGIVMLRSTISRIIIEQQVGRCLTADNKDNNPVVLDLVNNMDIIRYDSKYTFSDGSYSEEKEKSESDGFPFKVIDECRDIRLFYEQMEREIITRGEDIEVHIERMLAWVAENGTVLYNSCPEAAWFRDLLRSNRRNRFEDVIQRLRNIGIMLPMEAFPRLSWDEKFQVFLDWKKEHHGKIPSSTDKEIGVWVHYQISEFNLGRLTAERSEKVKNEMIIHVMTDEEVMDILRKAISNGEDINKYSKGHGDISAFIRKIKTTEYKMSHLEIAIELYNAGLKTDIPYTFEAGYQYAKKYFDEHLEFGKKRGMTVFKNCPDRYIRNWRIQIATKYDKCTTDQQRMLNEMGIHMRILAPLEIRLEKIEDEYSKIGELSPKNRQWISVHKDELKERGLWSRVKQAGYIELGDSAKLMMERFEEIHKDGRVRSINELPSDVYSFIRREINADRKYGIRMREIGYRSVKEVTEENKKMFSEWLAENRCIPQAKKNNGNVMSEDVEYRCYVCMSTWSKCKTPQLVKFVNDELAKYGLSYQVKGMTLQDYRNEFICKVTAFRDSGGDYLSLHKKDKLYNMIDSYRRKAIANNDSEILDLLKSVGAMISPEERAAIKLDSSIMEIASFLASGGKMSCKCKYYVKLKHYGTCVANGTIAPHILDVLKKYHFVLDDGSFCNYIGREYNFEIK